MAADPQVAYKSSHSRDKLEEYIGDYNAQYGTAFSTKDSQQFENYFKDISKRLKEREKDSFNDEKDRLDLVLVVQAREIGERIIFKMKDYVEVFVNVMIA